MEWSCRSEQAHSVTTTIKNMLITSLFLSVINISTYRFNDTVPYSMVNYQHQNLQARCGWVIVNHLTASFWQFPKFHQKFKKLIGERGASLTQYLCCNSVLRQLKQLWFLHCLIRMSPCYNVRELQCEVGKRISSQRRTPSKMEGGGECVSFLLNICTVYMALELLFLYCF